ncbi:hypothetical protein HGRIS_009777 [Hohenbuehelia grisea]|uniref:Uncharacterized protein n=1 Tax=Hohenbuehelia grisea TaxID=104357 RepID=A0ABR3J2D8_9AGAR
MPPPPPPSFNVFKAFSRRPKVVVPEPAEEEWNPEPRAIKPGRSSRRVLRRKDKDRIMTNMQGYGGPSLPPVPEVPLSRAVSFREHDAVSHHEMPLQPPPPIDAPIEADEGWPGYDGDDHRRPSFDRGPMELRNDSPSRLREILSDHGSARVKIHLQPPSDIGEGSVRRAMQDPPTPYAPSISGVPFPDPPHDHHHPPTIVEGVASRDYVASSLHRPESPSPEPLPVPPPIRRSHTERSARVQRHPTVSQHLPSERRGRSPPPPREQAPRDLRGGPALQSNNHGYHRSHYRDQDRDRDRYRDRDRDRDRGRRQDGHRGTYRDAPRDTHRSAAKNADHKPRAAPVRPPPTQPVLAKPPPTQTPIQPPLPKGPATGIHQYVVPAGANVIFQDEDGNEITRVGNLPSTYQHGSTKSERRTVPIIVQDEFGRELYRTGTVSSGGKGHIEGGHRPRSQSASLPQRGPNLFFIDKRGRQIPIITDAYGQRSYYPGH